MEQPEPIEEPIEEQEADFLAGVEVQPVDWEAQVCIDCD